MSGKLNFLKVHDDVSKNDVLLHSDKLSKYCLQLKVGDAVEFEFNRRDKARPSVARVKPLAFLDRTRTDSELSDYFDEVVENLSGKNCVEAITGNSDNISSLFD